MQPINADTINRAFSGSTGCFGSPHTFYVGAARRWVEWVPPKKPVEPKNQSPISDVPREVAMVRLTTQRSIQMSAIGTLKADDKGGYSFLIKTLTQQNIKGDLVPVKEKKGNGPDFRAFMKDQTEIGAAWVKSGENGDYISLLLDDPFMPAALYANSYVREDGSIVLLWTRSNR